MVRPRGWLGMAPRNSMTMSLPKSLLVQGLPPRKRDDFRARHVLCHREGAAFSIV